ncbi:hypothetical protein [Spirosoma endbachense]|uniref:Curlin n=1 Tax=Spirosoma endbachense TaxID=2666025 RepID=A0A6P1VSD5_9BACT|nr:hypothetical protein [Spirosoma endbachense]QHV96141.1 hypothetical protein GJR95_14485 [Spirosoma endbachense]
MKRLVVMLLFGLPLATSAQSEVYYRQPPDDRNRTGLTSSEITLVQTGQLNQLNYQETGRGNAVNLVQQGSNNVLDVAISGSDNRYSFVQQGDNNAAQWQSRQNNGQLEVIQRGNNNQLMQDGSMPAMGVSMRIEQNGGMQLLIKNNF